MYYLVYISSATTLMTDQALTELAAECQEANRRAKITGILLYKNGNFLQLIEGSKESILGLFATLKADARHKDVYKMMTGDSASRLFGDWEMAFINVSEGRVNEALSRYVEDRIACLKSDDSAIAAYRFISEFNSRND